MIEYQKLRTKDAKLSLQSSVWTRPGPQDDAFSRDTLSGTWVANSGKISENVLRTGDQTQDSETMHKGEGRFMLSGGAPQTVSFPRQTMLCARRAYRNDKGSTFTALGREVIIALVVGSIYYGTLDTSVYGDYYVGGFSIGADSGICMSFAKHDRSESESWEISK
jgi:hypothetical protein